MLLKNPSSFQESISVEKEWDGIEVDMMLEEDTFDLGPDEEEDYRHLQQSNPIVLRTLLRLHPRCNGNQRRHARLA